MSKTLFPPDEARKVREACGLSQAAVARELGLNRTYLSLFECGRYILPDEALVSLREFYERHNYQLGNDVPSDVDSRTAPVPNEHETALAAELEQHRSAALRILETQARPGFLWGYDEEDCDEKINSSLLHIARAYFLSERIRGNGDFSICSAKADGAEKSSPQHIGDILREKIDNFVAS